METVDVCFALSAVLVLLLSHHAAALIVISCPAPLLHFADSATLTEVPGGVKAGDIGTVTMGKQDSYRW